MQLLGVQTTTNWIRGLEEMYPGPCITGWAGAAPRRVSGGVGGAGSGGAQGARRGAAWLPRAKGWSTRGEGWTKENCTLLQPIKLRL